MGECSSQLTLFQLGATGENVVTGTENAQIQVPRLRLNILDMLRVELPHVPCSPGGHSDISGGGPTLQIEGEPRMAPSRPRKHERDTPTSSASELSPKRACAVQTPVLGGLRRPLHTVV